MKSTKIRAAIPSNKTSIWCGLIFMYFAHIRKNRTGALVEQEPEFTPNFSGVSVTHSLVLCVCFADRCLSFCSFSFGHCVVCPSSIYGFWLPLWYLQTRLICTRKLYRMQFESFQSAAFFKFILKIWQLVIHSFPSRNHLFQTDIWIFYIFVTKSIRKLINGQIRLPYGRMSLMR